MTSSRPGTAPTRPCAPSPGSCPGGCTQPRAQADFRYVNVAEWTTSDAFAAALGSPAFQEAARTLPFTSHPALYEVVRD